MKLFLVLIFATAAAAQTVTIGPPVFTGAGLNDATSGGRFTGVPANAVYNVVICTAATPDTAKLQKNGGSFSSCAPILAGTNALLDGVAIAFAATTGHTVGDAWAISATANGSVSASSFVQRGVGAVYRDAQSKARETVSVLDFGAAPDWNGSAGTDNLAAFNAAAAATMPSGQSLVIPPGKYYLSGSWTLPCATHANSIWEVSGQSGNNIGYGLRGTVLVFASGGLVVQDCSVLDIHDFAVQALASAGPNISLTGNVAEVSVRRMALSSANPAKSLIRGDTGGGGDLELITIDDNDYYPANSYSVPPVWLSNAAGNSTLNPGTIRGTSRQFHGSPTASAPFLKLDCGAFSGCSNWRLQDLLFEAVPQGAIELDGITNSILTNINTADSGTVTVPALKMTAVPGGTINNITIINPNLQESTATVPAILVDVTGVYGTPQITIIGGTVASARLKPNLYGSAITEIGTRTTDLEDVLILSSDRNVGTSQGALNSSSLNGSSSLTQNPGSLFFPAFSGCVSGSDLVVGSDAHYVSSASHSFSAYDVGGYLMITGGTGFTVGSFQIIGVGSGGTAGQAILQTTAGTSGSTAGQWNVNRGRFGFNIFTLSGAGTADTYGYCSMNADGSYTVKHPLIAGQENWALGYGSASGLQIGGTFGVTGNGGIALGATPVYGAIDSGSRFGFQANGLGAGLTHYLQTISGVLRMVGPGGVGWQVNDTTNTFDASTALSVNGTIRISQAGVGTFAAGTTINGAAPITGCTTATSPALCTNAACTTTTTLTYVAHCP